MRATQPLVILSLVMSFFAPPVLATHTCVMQKTKISPDGRLVPSSVAVISTAPTAKPVDARRLSDVGPFLVSAEFKGMYQLLSVAVSGHPILGWSPSTNFVPQPHAVCI